MGNRYSIILKKVNLLFCGGLFLFFGFLAYNIPLTGDDWMWGSHKGMELLESNYKDYNGRYLSNTVEVLLTRYDWFRVLFYALFSTLLVYMTGKLFKKETKWPMLMAFVLFMLVPIRIFAQTFGWIAGYVNYIPSLVLLIIYLYIIQNILEDEPPVYKKSYTYWMIPLGLSTVLIVEHITLFAIFTAGIVILYTYYKHKKWYSMQLAYLFSTVIGAVIMFTNGAYLNILLGKETYRTIREYDGIIDRFYTTYKESMYSFLFIDNVLIHLIISALLILLLVKTTSTKKWVEKAVKPFFIFVILSFDIFLLIFKKVLGSHYLGIHTADFEAWFTLLFFITMVATVLLFVSQKSIKIRLMYYVSGIVLLTIPFVYITPYGPRCVLGAYTFMTLFAMELLVYLGKEYEWSFAGLKKVLGISSLVLIMVFSFIMYLNGDAHRTRIDKLQSDLKKNEEVIEITELPYPQFHWMPTPVKTLGHRHHFKVLYNVPADTEINIIPYFQSQR